MARPLRLEIAGGLYHVTSRGDRREDIFLDDTERERWLTTLAQWCERFNWAIHAWCQMSNHYHLLIETPDGNLSAGMRQLNGVYTQLVNRRHQRVGHVFQGSYKAIIVDRDSYLLALARYVVLNPVRAGMVKQVRDWPWSSYHATLDARVRPTWLKVDWVLSQLGVQKKRQLERYVEFIQQGLRGDQRDVTIWESLRGQVFLGSDAFVQAMQDRMASVANLTHPEIPRMQRRALANPLKFYQREFDDPKQGMIAAYGTGDYTLQAIADAFEVHYSTVSRAINGK